MATNNTKKNDSQIPVCNTTIHDKKYYMSDSDANSYLGDLTGISVYCCSMICVLFFMALIAIFGGMNYYEHGWNACNIFMLVICILGIGCCSFSAVKIVESQNDLKHMDVTGRPCLDKTNNKVLLPEK